MTGRLFITKVVYLSCSLEHSDTFPQCLRHSLDYKVVFFCVSINFSYIHTVHTCRARTTDLRDRSMALHAAIDGYIVSTSIRRSRNHQSYLRIHRYCCAIDQWLLDRPMHALTIDRSIAQIRRSRTTHNTLDAVLKT